MNEGKLRGTFFAITSAALYGLCAALTKLVTSGGVSVAAMVVSRGVIGATVLLLLGFIRKKPISISKPNRIKVLVLGLFGTATTLIFLNLAYGYLPVGTVTTIHFLYPAVVSAASAALFHEKTRAITVVTIVVSTAAMFLFFESFDASKAMGLMFAALSVFGWAFQLVFLERSGLLVEDSCSIAFFMCCMTAVAGTVYGLLDGSLRFNGVAQSFGLIALITVLNNVLAMVFVQKGVALLGAGPAAVLSVFEPIGSIVFGALIMGEQLTSRQILASIIILTSVTVMIVCLARRTVDERH